MTIIDIIILSVLLCLLAYCVFMLVRNEKVANFRHYITGHLVFRNDGNYHVRLKIYNRVSYHKMLHSFKPLRLESFYTKEEIEILKS